ncbi:cbb3-type cytochrome c oxidase accessory protein CcoG [Melioribacter roseus P3M-2]|uniref:Cbb3-type cytochrome c oxidase accessory protein CcoG n=1 Tax=Melioribacter roseus (strain DSM 23840 / JCM 17771 / VKM B-2668 / P3M-2) TaxID=1191523 RepID=I7A0G7_MELRP|nr:cytochrome c oxidase accessory protein CcoG [Melioribacter roseus]AFN74753.1 cbb3-type cytochrome c oxidase accessory protein CcoG [Melioribacter roseus P3M-2]
MNKTAEDVSRETFRDSISTVTKEGKRRWIYPKKPSGKFYRARTIVSVFLLLFLVASPFIKVAGRPFILFNVLERKFVVFGIYFGPQDIYFFALAMIAFIVSIFLFTVVYGRLFCGWICPQTVFMEMVFRKIEYWLEGDAKEQRKLNQLPMNPRKFRIKAAKHIIFFAISFAIANIFLAYIIGSDNLLKYITHSPALHAGTFIAVLIFSGVFYFVFSYFREQACVLVCPYGRLQGVMLDENSIVIHYDYRRGEPRGKLRRGEERNAGDCIDCNQCVEVCPTGIDIRNGTQLECVNCTACIDACDYVMDRIGKPKGLIRYASKNEIETGRRPIMTPKAVGYTVVLFLLLFLISFLLINRAELDVNILRTPGLLSQDQPGNRISNLYDIKIVNKTSKEIIPKIEVDNINAEIKIIGENLKVKPQSIAEAKFFIILPKSEIKTIKTPLTVNVYANDKVIKKINTSFLARTEKK